MIVRRAILLSLVILNCLGHRSFAGETDSESAVAGSAEVTELCKSGIEGSGTVQVGARRHARINVFCIDSERFAASLYVEGMLNLSLTYSMVSKRILVLSQFPLQLDQRKGTSTSAMTYLKLNFTKLKAGIIKGYVVNGNLTEPLAISGKIDQRFPTIESLVSKPIDHSDFIGTYGFQLPAGRAAEAMSSQPPQGAENVNMWVDINQNIPILNMKIDIPLPSMNSTFKASSAGNGGGAAIHFIDGASWDGKTGFEATTSFSDSSVTGVTLWHVRGRALDKGVLELYVIDPVNGLRGPVVARRKADPGKYLEMDLGTAPQTK